MTVCTRCGVVAKPNDQYCPGCGQRLDVHEASRPGSVPSAPMYASPASGAGAWHSSEPAYSAPRVQPAVEPQVARASSGTPVATATIAPAAAVGRLVVYPPETVAEPVREYALDGRQIAIGRSASCDIVLPDDLLVSRRHALLRHDGKSYVVVDLGSSNGTQLNGAELAAATSLREGDRLTVGDYQIDFSTTLASADAAPASGGEPDQYALTPMPSPPTTTNPHTPAVTLAELAGEEHHFIPATSPITLAESTRDQFQGSDAPAGQSQPQSEWPSVPMEEMELERDRAASSSRPAPAFSSLADDVSDLNTITPPPSTPSWSWPAPDVAEEETVPTTSPEAAGETALRIPAVPSRSAHTADLAAIRGQVESLASVVGSLADRAESAEQQAAQLRHAFAQASQRIATVIAEQERVTLEPSDEDSVELSRLIDVTRQAAENPRHLDFLMQFAERAGDILNVLESRQARQTAPLDTLHALRDLQDWLARQG